MLVKKISERRREQTWCVTEAAKFLFGFERSRAAAVCLH
jgi:hypothetical protein